jgi:ribosomal protein S18 acetylase RimI-like enzyme
MESLKQDAIQGPFLRQSQVCEPILRSLPDWFGIESALQRYVVEIDTLPTFIALMEQKVVGFLTLKQHTAYAAEIYVMGLYPEVHRRGLGRALVQHAENTLSQAGVDYLQVKTLSPSREDEHYARTRAFYYTVGFRPLEEIEQLWGDENPCLLMVKYIGGLR